MCDTVSNIDRITSMINASNRYMNASTFFEKLYDIVIRFNIPSYLDKDFIYNSLIEHFSLIEDYEKCIELVRMKNSGMPYSNSKFVNSGITETELDFIKSIGYRIPDCITLLLIS